MNNLRKTKRLPALPIFFSRLPALLPCTAVHSDVRQGTVASNLKERQRLRGKTEMKHFATEEWIDFVKQVITSDQRQTMQQHLAACKACAETVALWQKVERQAAVEPSFQPPADAVRLAKAAFAGSGFAAAAQQKSTNNVIETLFDSFLQPALAGARSVVIGTRQMLYRAEPYQIDIQIEPKPGTNRLMITGQIMEVTGSGATLQGLQITLSNRRGNSAIAPTNAFGEFSGEIENSGDLELSIPGRSEQPIVISLRNALDRFSGGKA